MKVSPVVKICTKCKEKYPATVKYFYQDKSKKDGLRPDCKQCSNKVTRKYRQTKAGKQVDCRKCKKYYSTIKGHLKHIFNGIKQRCNNPKCAGYRDYGGRGIKNKFKSLDEFRNYVIDELQIDPCNLTIDRIDNNGNYEKGNIRFITQKENCNNKKR